MLPSPRLLFTSPRLLFSDIMREITTEPSVVVGEVVHKSERVANFFRVIPHLEKYLAGAYLVFLDSFLFHLITLPLRAVYSVLCLKPRRGDCLRVLIMLVVGGVLYWAADASRLYHMIRGQSALKLYVIFNLIDVADKLLGSFGLDVLDAYQEGGGHDDVLHPVLHFMVAILYTLLHATVLLYQMLTLNVAVNSFSHALLTLLVSNQFVEIKSAVFKKFDPDTLMQLAGGDGVERVQLTLYILMIALRDWTEGSIAWGRLLPPLLSIYASELVVDWLKHAFITKFNNLSPRLYSQYYASMQEELKKGGDVSNRLAKRAGFCALPLCCVVLKTLFSCRPFYTALMLLSCFLLKAITSHAVNHANHITTTKKTL